MEFQLSSYIDAELLAREVAGNTVENYILAIGVFILSVIILKVFKFIIVNRLKRFASKTETKADDILFNSVDRVKWHFYVVLALYLAVQFLLVPAIIPTLLLYLIIIVGTYYVVLVVQDVIDFVTQSIAHQKQKEDGHTDTSIIELIGKILKYVVWIVALMLILSNVGFDVTPMIAGLGIGGIAIAFAFQNVLTDIFASFTIYFDKPFKKGDFIIVGSDMGTVEKIGIKSTRIRTLQGQELIMSNKELTEARINNYKQMQKRRISFAFGVTYETPVKKLEKIPEMVENVIKNAELAKFDRVHFKSFGDSALNYEVVYYVQTNVYNKYMDIQQQINLGIMKQFEKEKIDMAYPTQTLYVNKVK